MKRSRWIGLILLVTIGILQAEVEWHGFLMQHSAFRLQSPQDAMLLRTRWRLNGEYSRDNLFGYASLDVMNDLTRQEATIIDLKMAYIDLYGERLDWRIGKQQVVWGKADGYFINDIVNPLDLSYFLLQDFEDIRMATTLVKAKWHTGNHSLETVFIPEFKPTKLLFSGNWGFARPDSVTFDLSQFNAALPAMPLTLPLYYETDIQGEYSLRKAEWGFKLNTFLFGTDLSLIYLKMREDRPVYRKTVEMETMTIAPGVTIPVPTQLILQPTHPWLKFYGFNFSRPFGMWVLRGEGGYFPKRYFDSASMSALQNSNGVVAKPFWQGMLGLEYQLTASIDLSVQAIHEQIEKYTAGIQTDKQTNIGTLMLRGHFANETLSPLCLMLYNFEDKSYLSRLLVEWNYADNLVLAAGIDLLGGKADTIFGRFDRNDNVYFKIVYSF